MRDGKLDPLTRAALLREYARAREQRLARVRVSSDPDRCKYCGRRRALKAWNQDRCTLDGHALCVVTPEFMQLVRTIGARPVTYAALTEALGVSLQTVRQWMREAQRRYARADG